MKLLRINAIIFLFMLLCITAIADDGVLDDKLLKKFEDNLLTLGDQAAKINALTNNDIKSMSLNREKVVAHEDYMNFKLKGSDITNQKGSGRCWMFAGGNVYSPKIMTKMKLSNFELSQSYLAFWDKMEKSNLFLENIIKYRDKEYGDRGFETILDSPFGDGGWWHYFTDLVEKYGLVPKSAMPETKQSSSTGNVNNLATQILRKAASEIRQLHRWGKKEKEMRQIKEEALSDIYRLLVYTYGQPPKQFDFRIESSDTTIESSKKTYTPESFSAEFLGTEMPQYVALINNPAREYFKTFELTGSRNLFEKKDLTVLNITSEKLRDYTLASLKDSQVVWFACDVGKDNYGDSGIFAVDIYDYNKTFDIDFKLSKKDNINLKEISPNHAMVIVGTDTTDTGEATKWLVENSWGSDAGDKGFWYMYNDWFDEYAFMIIIDKKLLSEEDALLFEQKPIPVPIWDPFFLSLRRLEGNK